MKSSKFTFEMGDQTLTDFVVDSNGLCFLCLNKIRSSHLPPKDEPSSIHSLQYLSRYLKMDMTRVFNETDAITPELLAKVEGSRLKVELCEECTSLNETFSKLYRQLEKIELGVKSCINLIKNKLSIVNNDTKADYQFGINSVDGFNGKLRILEVLRMEIDEKCSNKLGVELPRIKLQSLSLKQVDTEKRKIKSSCLLEIRRGRQGLDHFANISDGTIKVDDSNIHFMDHNDANSYIDDDNDNYDEAIEQGSEQVARNYVEQEATRSGATAKPRITIDESVYTISSETGRYQCKLCTKELKDAYCFKMHYEGLHLKIRYKCSKCGKELQSKRSYNRHVQTEHLKIRFKCPGCGHSYSEKYKLKKHQQLKRCGVGSGELSV